MNQTQKLILLGGLISLLGFLTLTQRGKEAASFVGEKITGVVMGISNAGLNLLKQIEGFSAKPYRDADGWSIGYGHFMGSTPTMSTATVQEAETLLFQDVKIAENTINNYVKVPLTQNQYDALVSFIYNIGQPRFLTSTLLRLLNKGDYAGAADQFLLWNKSTQNGVRSVNPVLVARREAERQLFVS